ncbi:amidophosphoribosyltransferase [Candidatus Micrarchaeota archaeon]|nr:amidophosphoribosyltransferase [Candidatus Micrarchaeota archaeon]
MSELVKGKCGVFGIASDREIALDIYAGLMALQHRGQESCGIATFDGSSLRVHRDMGLVGEVFDDKKLQGLLGNRGIGHVRYSTTGGSLFENAQPFYFKAPKVEIALGFNGNLTNYNSLKERLEEEGRIFTSTTDAEVIAHLIAKELSKSNDVFEVVKNALSQLEGAYSLTILTGDGKVVAARDPLGFRPLCLGKRKDGYVVASETAALDAVEAEFVREIEPGEIVIIDDKVSSKKALKGNRRAHCMFEFVYFARADSIFEGKDIYDVRERLGKKLAELYKLDVDVVVPIPDSGRSTAYGYSVASGKRMAEGLIKNRYVYRTFIMPTVKGRKSSVKLKLNAVRSIVKGKKIALVDDSIVRGTTINKIAQLLRSAGAKEIHLLISCPPIISPCYMGIDFPTKKELIASGKSVEEIKKEIGVDSLNYMTIEGLIEAIGLPKNNLCTACLTGEYPVKIEKRDLG